MAEVRKHKRQLASGRTANVRRHHRNTGSARENPRPEPVFDPEHRAPSVESGALQPAAAPPPRQSWWDDDGQPAQGDWWDEEEENSQDCGHAHCTLCGKCLTCAPHPPHTELGNAAGQPRDVATRHAAGWADPELTDQEWADRTKATAAEHGYHVAETPDFASREEAEAYLRAQGFEPLPPDVGTRRGDRALPGMQAQMRAWRSRDIAVPAAEPDTSPLGNALGTGTPEGAARFARLKAYREAGYDGPLDEDNRIPDPDDPANFGTLRTFAAMRAMRESRG